MKKLIPYKIAANTCITIFALLVIMHIGIILGIVFFDFAPYEYIWGGQTESAKELLSFEIISVVSASLFLIIALIASSIIKISKLRFAAQILMWLIAAMFALNTLGNILAKSMFEKFFTVITVLLTIMSIRMGLGDSKN